MSKKFWLFASMTLIMNSVMAGELEWASIGFTRTWTLSSDDVSYNVVWDCQGENWKRILLKRPRAANCSIKNKLMLSSFQYQTMDLDQTTFEKEYREGLYEIVASFSGGGKEEATLDLAYNQFPDFVFPTNLEEGATGVTFPFTIEWDAVEADEIWIEIHVSGLTSGNSVSGDATSFEMQKWLYMPGKTYTVNFEAVKYAAGGVEADNAIQSSTVLTFTSADE